MIKVANTWVEDDEEAFKNHKQNHLYPWHFHKTDLFNGKVPKLRIFLKKT
jgi:hypothetical protein